MLTALLSGTHSAMMRALRTLCLDKLSPHWAMVICPLGGGFSKKICICALWSGFICLVGCFVLLVFGLGRQLFFFF